VISTSYLNPASNPILCNKLLLPQLVVNQYWIKFLLQYLLGIRHPLHYQQLLVLIMRLSNFNRWRILLVRLNRLKLHIADSTHITGEHFFLTIYVTGRTYIEMVDYFYSFISYLLNLYMRIIRSSVTIAVGPPALQNPYRLACLACSQAPFPLYKGSLRSLRVSVFTVSQFAQCV